MICGGGPWPELPEPRAGPGLVSDQSFSDALATFPANCSHRAITSPRYFLSLGVVASAWSLLARAAAVR